jgi:hypothetical protein
MEEIIGNIGYWLAVVGFSAVLLVPIMLILGFFLQVAMVTIAVILAIPYCLICFFRGLFSSSEV